MAAAAGGRDSKLARRARLAWQRVRWRGGGQQAAAQPASELPPACRGRVPGGVELMAAGAPLALHPTAISALFYSFVHSLIPRFPDPPVLSKMQVNDISLEDYIAAKPILWF